MKNKPTVWAGEMQPKGRGTGYTVHRVGLKTHVRTEMSAPHAWQESGPVLAA